MKNLKGKAVKFILPMILGSLAGFLMSCLMAYLIGCLLLECGLYVSHMKFLLTSIGYGAAAGILWAFVDILDEKNPQ